MADELVKLGISPDGIGFEKKFLDASGVKSADGVTVQEHMTDESKHATAAVIDAKDAVTLNAAKAYADTETAKKQNKITASGLLRGDGSGGVTGGVLSVGDIPALPLSKLSDAGTAAGKNAGTASGNVPVLGADGKLDASVVPAIAITDTFVVSTQAAMLALSAQLGDVCVRSDLSKSYILKASPASTLANWQELFTPSSPVQSVAGKTGAVTLTKSDVGLGNVDNTADNAKTVAAAGSVPWSGVTGKPTTLSGYGITDAPTAALAAATQAEAEAGTGTTARSWTPQRIRQAIDAYKDIVFVNTESEIATSKVRPGGIVLVKV